MNVASQSSRIEAEQIRLVYRQLPTVLLSNVVMAGATAYAVWDFVDRRLIVPWAVVIMLMVSARVVLARHFSRAASRSEDVDAADMRRWGHRFVIGSACGGLLWGGGVTAFYAQVPFEYQLYLIFIVVAMVSGSITSLTAYMPAFYAYMPITVAPIVLYILTRGGAPNIAQGIMALLCLVVLTLFGRTIGRSLLESLRLRFENLELLQALNRQKEAAEQANLAKSKFLTAASHDLRQPLHALSMYASALADRNVDSQMHGMVDGIASAASSMERLLNALLDISALDAGVIEPQRFSFRLDGVIGRIVADLRPVAAAKKIAIEAPPTQAVVLSDAALLERIVRNYLANAVRYTHEGEVKLVCTSDGDCIRIDVIDTGTGIEAKYHEEIFREFHQLQNPARDRSKGLGLGLAIVERIARLLDHRIGMQSAPRKGSTFSVWVPQGDPAAAFKADELRQLRETRFRSEGTRVLLLDDDPEGRDALAALLSTWGCEVHAFADQDEVDRWLSLAQDPPHVLIVDYRLRDGLSGIDALATLQRRLPECIPALIITGDIAAEQLREVAASGSPVLHKPVAPQKLRAFLRQAVRSVEARTILQAASSNAAISDR